MKQSEIIEWAMRGIVEEKITTQDEVRKLELDDMLKELSLLFYFALQEEKKQGYLSCLP